MKKSKKLITAFLTFAILISAFTLAINSQVRDTNFAWANLSSGFLESANRIVWSQNGGKILTGQRNGLLVAHGDMWGLAVDEGQRYAFAGFLGGSANQRAVEMINMYTSNSASVYQYRNAEGSYLNPRALSVDSDGYLYVGLDGGGAALVALVKYDLENATMDQVGVYNVHNVDGTLLVRSAKHRVVGGVEYVYVVTADGNDAKDTARENFINDRVYRYKVVVADGIKTLEIDTAFGTDNLGYFVPGAFTAAWTQTTDAYGKDRDIAEIFDVEVDVTGKIFVSTATRLHGIAVSADGKTYLNQQMVEDKNHRWGQGPLAYVGDAPEGKYIIVGTNKDTTGTHTPGTKVSNAYNVYNSETCAIIGGGNAFRGISFHKEAGTPTYRNFEQQKNFHRALDYVGGNLYTAHQGLGNASDDVFDIVNHDMIIIITLTEAGHAPSHKIFAAQSAPTEPLRAIWAQSNSDILTGEGGTLKKASGVMQGFTVSPDEKYAFAGFVGGTAEQRALEMIDLASGQSLGAFQHKGSDDVYAFMRAVAADGENTLYIALDGTADNAQIAVATYDDEGNITLKNVFTVLDKSGARINALKYMEFGSNSYLYVVTGDGTDDNDKDSLSNDRVYRLNISADKTLSVDTNFGTTNGYTIPSLLAPADHVSEGLVCELYSIDVASDGTVYLSSTRNIVTVRLTNNGKLYKKINGANHSLDFGGGGIVVINDYFVLTSLNPTTGNMTTRGQMMASFCDRGYGVFNANAGAENYRFTLPETLNLNPHMQYVNGTLYVADMGTGVETDELDVNADKIWAATYNYNDTDKNEIRLKAYQKTNANEAGEYNIRFAAVIDTLDYSEAGFEAVVTKADGSVVNYTGEDIIKCKYAYTNLGSISGIIRPGTFGGKYFIAVVFDEIPVSDGEVTIVIKPYVVKNGERLYGTEKTVVVNPPSI